MMLAEATQWVNECEFNCNETPINHKLWFCSALCWRLSGAIGMTVTVADDNLSAYDELWQRCGRDESECEYETDDVCASVEEVIEHTMSQEDNDAG